MNDQLHLYIVQGNRRWFLVKGFEGSLGVVTIYVNHGTVNDQNQNVWKLHDPAAWSLNSEKRIKRKNVSWPVSRTKNIIVLLSVLPPRLSSAAFTCFLWLVITFFFLFYYSNLTLDLQIAIHPWLFKRWQDKMANDLLSFWHFVRLNYFRHLIQTIST